MTQELSTELTHRTPTAKSLGSGFPAAIDPLSGLAVRLCMAAIA
jgi:hypothetical protein